MFPGHWSFMLGEIALYSFVLLLLSGTYLALFFDPSMEELTYAGPRPASSSGRPTASSSRCTSR